MALVIPGRGKAAETAMLLLELADSVWQVQTTTEFGGDMGVAFVIPDDLHDRYLRATGHGEEEGEAPERKRRGRPRKAATPVDRDVVPDDNEKEEE